MKTLFVSLVIAILAPFAAHGQNDTRSIKNRAFTHGEFIKYKVYYGWIDAGFASIKIQDQPAEMCGRSTYRVVGIGESSRTFDWFFKVRDRYESYIDKEMMAPLAFVRRVDEGGYTIKQDYIFNPEKETVFTGKKLVNTPAYVQDLLSAYYFARTQDMRNAKPGELISVPCFVDDTLFTAKIRFIGRETITTDLGTFKCMVFRPVIQTGRIFKHEEDMNVWITDDENKIPIRAEAKILVGSIKMDLIDYSGLLNPLAKISR
jgi:hypothetical protein